jgi:hypothetical protein
VKSIWTYHFLFTPSSSHIIIFFDSIILIIIIIIHHHHHHHASLIFQKLQQGAIEALHAYYEALDKRSEILIVPPLSSSPSHQPDDDAAAASSTHSSSSPPFPSLPASPLQASPLTPLPSSPRPSPASWLRLPRRWQGPGGRGRGGARFSLMDGAALPGLSARLGDETESDLYSFTTCL